MLALFSQTELFAIFNQQINPIFWGTIDLPASAQAFQQWGYGVLGAVMTGWGIFTTFIVHFPFKRAWTCLASGVLAWFVIDTFISLSFKVYFNVAFNAVLLIGLMLPLVFSRKYF